MIHKKSLFVLSFVLSVVTIQVMGQQSTKEPTLVTESIVGKWKLQKVYAGSREINRNPNSQDDTWIEFKENGTYEQSAETSDRGSYRLNEDQSIVYLESSDKKETSSATTVNTLREYSIAVNNGMLTLQSRETDSKPGTTKYVYVKSASNE